MEHQQLFGVPHGTLTGRATGLTHQQSIARLDTQYCMLRCHYRLPKMNFNGEWTAFVTLSMLHSNKQRCIIPKCRFKWSVHLISPRIHLDNYGCKISCLTFFILVALEPIFEKWYCTLQNVSFYSLSSTITEFWNSYSHVRFKFLKYLVAWGENIIQKLICP